MAALKPYAGIRGLNFSRICLEASSKRNNHIDVVKGQYDNLAAYKRGKGGRASFSGIVATVFGCSGYFGRSLISRLAKIGCQVICPYRGDTYYIKDIKLCGELGQILFVPYELTDEDAIRKSMKYSNVVINLIGRDWETKNFKFKDVHVDSAARLARIARESGVERFIHMSHLLAHPNPQTILLKKPSEFLTSKFEGEVAVRNEFPDATIFRPADMFGNHDRFLHYYADNWRKRRGCVPLWKKGEQTYKTPVFLSDVVEGVAAAVLDPSTAGNYYDCIGPQAYKLSELVDYFYRCMRLDDYKRINISPLFMAKVKFMSYAPSYPILNFDKLEREHMNDVSRSWLNLENLGVKLTSLESVAPHELKLYRYNAFYGEHVGEFPEPEPPMPYVI